MRQTTMELDRETFAGYVSAMTHALGKFAVGDEWAADNWHDPNIWDTEKIAAARIKPNIDTGQGGLFVGPWHVVRKWVTAETLAFFEGYGNRRMTFAEWRAQQILDRAAIAQREIDYYDSAAYCLDELTALRELTTRRDELILSARERGSGWREIGESIGMSRAQLHNIAARHAARLADSAPAYIDDDTPF